MKDVVIVGGGIIGVCTAFYLQQEGIDVTIVDEGNYNSGCTFGNAGMIVPSHFVPLASPGMMAKGIKWMFNKKSPFFIKPRLDADLLRWLWLFYTSSSRHHVQACAPLLRDMHEEGRAAFKEWSEHPSFAFNFGSNGILMLYNSKAGERDELEGAAMAHELGIKANPLKGSALTSLEPATKEGAVGGVHYPDDATISPDTFMQQMIDWLKQHGVTLLSKTRVVQVDEESPNRCLINCDGGNVIVAKRVIIANGVWASTLVARSGYTLPMQDGKGYSMTMNAEPGQPRIPAILHEARVALTPLENRFRMSGTLEISGLDDKIRQHKVQAILSAPLGYYKDFPMSQPGETWYGYRPCSPDGMPYIGKLNPHSSIIIATGHAMMGLSLAPATGRLVRDLLLRNIKVPAGLQPDRFRLRSS